LLATLLAILDPFLPFAFAATAIVYLIEFLRGPKAGVAGTVALALTIALSVLRLVAFVSVTGRPPLGPGEAYTVIALAITVIYAGFQVFRRDSSAGFLFLAVATIFQAIGVLPDPARVRIDTLLREPWFGLHVVSAIIGYTAFVVSAVYALLFLALYVDLKKRRFGVMYERMPSLDVLSRMAIRSTTLGFVFLTAAIAIGTIGWSRVLDHPALSDPKVVSSIVVWFIYGLGVMLHYFAGWRGVRCIGITLAAFVLMLLSTWLVPFVLGSAHLEKLL
jgi:ABC-type uncharacterized transport system permease subunit